jgi:serine/threonine-protein kinase RsbW
MGFDPPSLPHQIEIGSDLQSARGVEDEILREAEQMGFSPECAFAIRLALEEAVVNAHKHGNRCDTSKRIIVSYAVMPTRIVVRVRDGGPGFDPRLVPDPTAPDRISLPNGRGLMLMKAYLDEVRYNEQGNEVQLVKERC